MKWVILIIMAAVLGGIMSVYNGLVSRRNKVKNAWAQIDVQLKRRFDLIPNLVETVKGYATHEKDTLENVIKARNTYATAQTPEDAMNANNQIAGALNKLFALAESYPDLKANQNFIHLQAELTSVEDKIGYSRQFYNDTAMMYNNFRQIFPNNFISNWFNFNEETYFEADETERSNVQVKF
ncbi:MAG: LemA family protein [Lutispora sp.]|nr:LemA family protein [Lutispora sp.]MDD4833567.1 LemA family protein [Lutispora sp.]